MSGEPPAGDIHSREAASADNSGSASPDKEQLSTAETAASSPDIAVGALEAARSIVTGRAGGSDSGGAAGRMTRLRRRRRGSALDGPSYSGPRPDDRDPARLGDILGRESAELGWTAPLAHARLFGQWAAIVGPEIAGRCRPVSLTAGELKVSAESTAWATQLRLMAPQLLVRIAADLPPGMVKRIVFTGPAGPSWKHGPWSARGRGVRDTYG